MRRCTVCRQRYEPRFNSLESLCGPECALEFVRTRQDRMAKLRKQAERKAKAQFRRDNETLAEACSKAQRAFNAWIRARDAGLPCISCGHPDDGTRKRNAGHYRPAGANPALRFEPLNVHGQCERCNSYESGNLIAYRAGLIGRIGLAEVERLEGPHALPNRTREDFCVIAEHYRAALREMGKKRAA